MHKSSLAYHLAHDYHEGALPAGSMLPQLLNACLPVPVPWWTLANGIGHWIHNAFAGCSSTGGMDGFTASLSESWQQERLTHFPAIQSS